MAEKGDFMMDSFGRNINKLRVSVTEICDLACLYCISENGLHKEHSQRLSMQQLLDLVGLLAQHAGIEKVRITGGEPLVYPFITQFIEGILEKGIRNIGITSNGQLLKKYAKSLKNAGVEHMNISLDSLDPENFRHLARRGTLEKTLAGIEEALQVGMRIKLNTVVMKGKNDHEIVDILEFAMTSGIEVRFLELMKMGHLFQQSTTSASFPLFSMHEILARIQEKYQITPISTPEDSTALRFEVEGKGRFGIIPNESAPFCRTCSRLRLTSTGKLIGCLSNPQEISIRHLLEETQEKESELSQLVQTAISNKQRVAFTGSLLGMSQIGG